MNRLLDLDLLRTLLVIAEAGSLSAAAPRLCRSQSALSEQVRKLEDLCGLPLLLRGKTGASLTLAGERLAAHAREMLALNTAALRDVRGTLLAGDLRLAITDYFRPVALPGILRRVRDRFPHLRLHVSIRKSALIEEEANEKAQGKAAENDFDIGLSMSLLDRRRTNTRRTNKRSTDGRIRLRREPLAWVADKSFVMPENGVLPLVVLPDTCSLQRFIIKTLDAHAIPYAIAHSASGIGGLHLALAAGLGVTCLNASAIPEGATTFTGMARLPTKLPILPKVEFSLVPPSAGESAIVSEVRAMLAEQLG